MTTNTTKLAEAIGIISNVMTSEMAKANTLDNEENILVDDFDDLKDTAENFSNDVKNTVDTIQGEIDTCLEYKTGDSDFEEEEEETIETILAKEKKEESVDIVNEKIAELELTNAKLIAVLENIAENINDLYELNETFDEELEQY
tara:strand:+ start:153 stop:587 length:435 start_codon:yes stop_codon:yes gene_type:complete